MSAHPPTDDDPVTWSVIDIAPIDHVELLLNSRHGRIAGDFLADPDVAREFALILDRATRDRRTDPLISAIISMLLDRRMHAAFAEHVFHPAVTN